MHHPVHRCLIVILALLASAVAQQNFSANLSATAIKLLVLKHMNENYYDVSLAPKYPDRTHISLTVWPDKLRYVNEHMENIQVNTWIQLEWHDERLVTAQEVKQNESCYHIKMTPAQIWTPTVKVAERTFLTETETLDQPYITVNCTGDVQLRAMFLDETSCLLRMRNFPFDQQKCRITFVSEPDVHLHHKLLYDKLETTITHIDKMKGVEDYDSGAWRLYASTAVINQTFNDGKEYIAQGIETGYAGSSVLYKYYLTRKPSQYVLDWIVPPILLATSGVVTMFTGCNVCERHSFGGTLVVTLTLMLSSLREHTAVAYDGYPVLAQVYLGLTATTILATLLASLPSNIASTGVVETRQKIIRVGRLTERTPRKKSIGQKWLIWLGPDGKSEQELNMIIMGSMLFLQVVIVTYAVVCWSQRKMY